MWTMCPPLNIHWSVIRTEASGKQRYHSLEKEDIISLFLPFVLKKRRCSIHINSASVSELLCFTVG